MKKLRAPHSSIDFGNLFLNFRRLKILKILILTLSIAFLCGNAVAEEGSCTKAEAMEAESSVSQLNNWEDVYKSFKKFRFCDDGAIAEGYSDVVVRMLSNQWSQLGELVKPSSADKEFFVFVVKHIDATANKSEAENIIVNSSTKCPESAKIVCSEIEKSAREALKEIQKYSKP